MRQLELFPGMGTSQDDTEETPEPMTAAVIANRAELTLASRLAEHLPGRLARIDLTDNRVRLLSARPTPDGRLALRIHRCFAQAPEEVLAAVAELLTEGSSRGSEAAALVREYHAKHAPSPEQAPKGRQQELRPAGEHHDLQPMLERLNAQYFQDQLKLGVTWGPAPSGKRRSSIRLGSYQARTGVVRIHPALDKKWVPAYVVEAIVYHEMLHAAVPPVVRPGKRRNIHPPEFRRRERQHPDYERSELWIRKHLRRLLGSGVRGVYC